MSRENLDVSFAIALPPDWQQIDLLDPAAGEHVLEGPLAAALAFASHGSDEARMLMLRSLFALTPAGKPLAAGLAVTLADAGAPVSTEPLTPDSFAGSDVSAVSLPVGSGLRVRHVKPAVVFVGMDPVDVLRVQYLVHTPPGLLTITFTTPQAHPSGEWEQMFDAMATTSELI